MNFFEQQDAARAQTKRLVFLFVLALTILTLGIYAMLLAGVFFTDAPTGKAPFNPLRFDLLFYSTAGVSLIIGLAMFVKIKSLGAGGSAVAESVGGRLVTPGTSDPHERRLLNVVEEMAIASGVPVPAVYILDHERGINAFAAGYSINDAAVAVTRGTLMLLNRAELQGVIGHEFSHILNGDMRLNIRLIGVLFGLLMIGTTGKFIMRVGVGSGRGRNNKGAPAIAIIGLLIWILGSGGLFFGKLIQLAISRQREFLADASAVQFTRDSSGLANALKKIGGYTEGSLVHARGAQEISHMFFGDGMRRSLGSFFATHPPIDERIRRLEPNFSGQFPEIDDEARSLLTMSAAASPMSGLTSQAVSSNVQTDLGVATGRTQPIQAAAVLSSAGTTTPEHLSYSSNLLASIPEPLRLASQSPLSAVALTYAMLAVTGDDQQTQAQIAQIRQSTHPHIGDELERLVPLVHTLEPRARLPLLSLSVPVLRQLPPHQYQAFRQELSTIIFADNRVSLFEFVVYRSLSSWLDVHFGVSQPPRAQYYAISALAEPISVMLSALAYVGHNDFGSATAAFQQGAARIRLTKAGEVHLLPQQECSLKHLDDALNMLAMASPAIKGQLLDAAAYCVLADQDVTLAEGELLRVVADAFGAPLPPFLPGVG